MTFRKEDFTTTVVKAKELVPGFRGAFALFEERVVLDRLSRSLATNYGRNVAHLALDFMRLPHEVSVEEVNSYLYRKSVHEGFSESYFKQTVYSDESLPPFRSKVYHPFRSKVYQVFNSLRVH